MIKIQKSMSLDWFICQSCTNYVLFWFFSFLAITFVAFIFILTQPASAIEDASVILESDDKFIASATAPETPVATPLSIVNNEPSVSVSASAVDFGRISKVYGDRVVRTASNTITVNSPLYGYELYISSSDDSNNLVRYGAAGTSGTEIIPATPTISTINPTTLGDDTWGFAVKKRDITSNSGSEDVPITANFDTSYPTGDDSNPDNKFSAVPTRDNQLLIAERDFTATNVLTDVYFGVSIKDVPIGIYQSTITYTAIGKEPTTHTVKIKLIPNIDRVTLGDIECNASTAITSTDEGDPEGTKQCEVILTYGYSYSLEAIPTEGYKFKSWDLSNETGFFSDSNMSTTAFTAGQGDVTITPTTKPRQTITLNSNGATANGSENTIATHGEATLGAITNPTRSYDVSGFDISYNNASNATVTFQTTGSCTGATNCSANYRIDGWYAEAAAINKVASNDTMPVLQANTSYTNADGEWMSTSDQTLYAGWTEQAVTLPIITKEGYTCGWTTSTNTTVVSYSSGSIFTPSADIVFHGVCTPNPYTQTTYVRYQNANGTWGSYGVAEIKNVNYGDSYAWSRTADDTYQAASVASYTVNSAKNNYVDVYRNKFTVDINPILNGNIGGGGYDGFTFDVYIDGTLVADDTIDWASWSQGLSVTDGGYLRYGQVVRVIGNNVSGYTLTSGDTSYTITSTTDVSVPVWTDNIGPTHTNWWWGEVTKDVARLYIQATDVSGVQTVQCPTSTAAGGYGNWYWFNALWDSGANAWRCDITPSTFGHYDQTYVTHLYMYDSRGNGGYYNQTSIGIPTNLPYIQDYTNTLCQSQASSGNALVKDKRDGQEYTVRYINGSCWMTRNLNLVAGITVTSELSNVVSNYTIPSGGGDYIYGTSASGTDSNGIATMWYNFCATTAGTICVSESSSHSNPTYDICPKGWRLPTNSEVSGITSYISAFSPVKQGSFDSQVGYNTTRSFWWTSTQYSNSRQYLLSYDPSGNSMRSEYFWNERTYLHYVRCIRSS